MSSLLSGTLNTRYLHHSTKRYIRSDLPLHVSDADIQWLLDHNVRTIVDLRSFEECANKKCPLEAHAAFRYFHLPVTGGGDVPLSESAVVESYINMVDEQMKVIVGTSKNSGFIKWKR